MPEWQWPHQPSPVLEMSLHVHDSFGPAIAGAIQMQRIAQAVKTRTMVILLGRVLRDRNEMIDPVGHPPVTRRSRCGISLYTASYTLNLSKRQHIPARTSQPLI